MIPESDLPDMEDLAAYLDGKLSGARRAEVEERLIRDEDYYDVFLLSAWFLHQVPQEPSFGEWRQKPHDR